MMMCVTVNIYFLCNFWCSKFVIDLLTVVWWQINRWRWSCINRTFFIATLFVFTIIIFLWPASKARFYDCLESSSGEARRPRSYRGGQVPAGLQIDVGHGDVFRLRQRLDKEQRDTATECCSASQDHWSLPALRLTSKRTSQKMFPPSWSVLLGHTGRRQRHKHSAERQRRLSKHTMVRKGSPGMSVRNVHSIIFTFILLIWNLIWVWKSLSTVDYFLTE